MTPVHDDLVAGSPELILGSETISLKSLGLDIGSATSHLAVVDLHLERVNGSYDVTSRDVVYRSPVSLTPYRGDALIDADLLGSFIRSQCDAARESIGHIDVSVVLMTGAAALPENAAGVGELAGSGVPEFMSICAGDRLEAELAAHGSGAVGASLGGRNVLNIDIGGATTKLSWCQDGGIARTETYDFGSRVITVGADGKVTRMSDAGIRLGNLCGLQLAPGVLITEAERLLLAERLSEGIVAAAARQAHQGWTQSFLREMHSLNDPLFDSIVLSGGVAGFVSGESVASFGDLGDAVGVALARRLRDMGGEVYVAEDAIRSTALGLSKFAVQMSGATVALDRVELPLRDVPIVKIDPRLMTDDFSMVGGSIRERIAVLGLSGASRTIAVMMPWRGPITYARLDELSSAILDGLCSQIEAGSPTILVVDKDIGQTLGRHLIDERGLRGPVLVMDGIELRDFDFIDILRTGGVGAQQIMVTVKSLDFNAGSAKWLQVI